MFAGIYKGKRVLVIGHTGFKGSWLSAWLLRLGAKVGGFSIDVPSVPSNYEVLGLRERLVHFDGDIRDRTALEDTIRKFKPDIVFHLAAQALVRKSYAEPAMTFETNAIGTMNVLDCLRRADSVRVGVIITSDKCYKNVGWTWGYRENDTLGGADPYSASKACAELICASYIESYLKNGQVKVATTRAGNVIGGGDWAEDRIVPDSVRAWAKNEPMVMRFPQATRPWQHVLEPLGGYLWLGAKLWDGCPKAVGESFNFGPGATVNQSVEELIAAMSKYWPGSVWKLDPAASNAKPEASLLKLSCDKALNLLNWRAVLTFDDTVRFTAEWYKSYYGAKKTNMYELTMGQIDEYTSVARKEGQQWATS